MIINNWCWAMFFKSKCNQKLKCVSKSFVSEFCLNISSFYASLSDLPSWICSLHSIQPWKNAHNKLMFPFWKKPLETLINDVCIKYHLALLYYVIISISIIYIKMNRYFPWSRHHACTDGPMLLILFLKMFFEVQRGSSWREKFKKLPRK